MKKVKRYNEAGYVTSEDSNSGMKEAYDVGQAEMRINNAKERMRAEAEGAKDASKIIESGNQGFGGPGSSRIVKAPKPAIVTKEELEKSGMSLRDYLNKQQGLARRGEKNFIAGDSLTEQKSLGGKPKLDEYVPRDFDTRKGEIMRSKNAIPRDSFAKKSRIEERTMRAANAAPAGSEYTSTKDFMGIKDMAKDSKYSGSDTKEGGVRGEGGYGSKRGGLMKVKKMANGGSASSRADGIAQRGKTKGRIC